MTAVSSIRYAVVYFSKEGTMQGCISAILGLAMVLMFTAGCGGSGGSGGTANAATYGSLTFSGSGSAITGTSFTPTTKNYSSPSAGVVGFQWFSNKMSVDVKMSSILNMIIVQYDTGTTIYQWSSTISAADVTIGSSSVTFHNSTISGNLNTTSSLSLNGTLSY
jgi:hypothetical protein